MKEKAVLSDRLVELPLKPSADASDAAKSNKLKIQV